MTNGAEKAKVSLESVIWTPLAEMGFSVYITILGKKVNRRHALCFSLLKKINTSDI
jgi:hypothetical protein